jgi:hypothetical protein
MMTRNGSIRERAGLARDGGRKLGPPCHEWKVECAGAASTYAEAFKLI